MKTFVFGLLLPFLGTSLGAACVFSRNRELFREALAKFFVGLITVMLLLFIPAWTFRYPQAWLLICILFVPIFFAGLIMLRKNPKLLKKRLNAKEEESEQRKVILFSGIMFLVAFISAGLSFRFHFLMLPWAFSVIGAVLFLAAYVLYSEVLRENTYLSRTIEVQEDQIVIDTGLYGIVRHPMYMATVLLFLAMPLVLGSVVAFVIMLAYIPIIMKRIRNEEEVLIAGLAGYAEYKNKVKSRLIPFIW